MANWPYSIHSRYPKAETYLDDQQSLRVRGAGQAAKRVESRMVLIKLRKGVRRVEVSFAQPPLAMIAFAFAFTVLLTGLRMDAEVRLPQ